MKRRIHHHWQGWLVLLLGIAMVIMGLWIVTEMLRGAWPTFLPLILWAVALPLLVAGGWSLLDARPPGGVLTAAKRYVAAGSCAYLLVAGSLFHWAFIGREDLRHITSRWTIDAPVAPGTMRMVHLHLPSDKEGISFAYASEELAAYLESRDANTIEVLLRVHVVRGKDVSYTIEQVGSRTEWEYSQSFLQYTAPAGGATHDPGDHDHR